MKLYNTGTEMFSFEHGGGSYFIYPKFGTFERQREPYKVDIKDEKKGRTITLTRHRDIWVKTSDEGNNTNFVEIPKDFLPVAMRKANAEGRSDIKSEDLVVKMEIDRVAAIEAKMKEKEKELKEQEQALATKLATLKKVEEEAISRAASKHSR